MKIKSSMAQVGDVLALYIGNNTFAFMRLLHLIPEHTFLCEVFDHKEQAAIFKKEILHAKRLMPFVSANWRSYSNKKLWHSEIVYRDSGFTPQKDEIKKARLMNASQSIRFNVDRTPNSGEMLILVDDIWDAEEHAAMSKIHSSLDLAVNSEMLVCEIRNRLKLSPPFNYRNYEERPTMWQWLKANKVYVGPI